MKREFGLRRKNRTIIPIAVCCLGLTISGMQVHAEEASAQQNAADVVQDVLPNGKAVYNLLLIGSDRRDESWNGNSDVMIMATINAETKRVVLTSFMRDLYADIPGYGVHKLNYAYAVSGADLLEETLESNYDIEIDHHAAVDFNTMADIIDAIGGVEVELSQAEVDVLNGYLVSMNASDESISSAGTYMLSGNQAVAYMRIRYVGNNEYQRTQRQRDVMKYIFTSLQNLDPDAYKALALKVLPEIKHNMGAMDVLKLVGVLPKVASYEFVENRVPYDGLFSSQNELLVPDFGATIEKLHDVMYADGQQ